MSPFEAGSAMATASFGTNTQFRLKLYLFPQQFLQALNLLLASDNGLQHLCARA